MCAAALGSAHAELHMENRCSSVAGDSRWRACVTALEAAFTRWLDPSNFDAQGNQRLRLSELTAPILVPHPSR